MRRLLWLLAVPVIIGVWTGRRETGAPGSGDDHERYHGRSFTVVHVIDGDTFRIDVRDPISGDATTRVRLLGVDTPELAHDGMPAMHFADEAAQYVRRTIGRRTVHLKLPDDRTRGHYGRLLAYVYLEPAGPMLNERLLSKGLAYADTRFPHARREAFTRLEAGAESRKEGLWATVTPATMPRWRRER